MKETQDSQPAPNVYYFVVFIQKEKDGDEGDFL